MDKKRSRYFRYGFAFAALACLLGFLLSTYLRSGQQVQQSSGSHRTVIDMNGEVVKIPAVVNRTGSTGAVNQIVAMLGSANKLVAVSAANKTNPWMTKIFPVIGSAAAPFGGSDVNLEELMRVKPDVIFIIDNTGSPSAFKQLDKVKAIGIPVVQVHLRTPDEIKRAVKLIGQTLGPQEENVAAQYCAYYDLELARVSAKTNALPPEKRLKIYRAAGADGLSTEGKNTITQSWIDMAGGVNVAANAGVNGIGNKVLLEDIVKWNPDIIIATDKTARDAIINSDGWKSISAVKNHRVYRNPSGVYEWSVRSAETSLQVPWAAKLIHPELFPEIDMNHEVKYFYHTFYHYELSDGEVNAILNPSR